VFSILRAPFPFPTWAAVWPLRKHTQTPGPLPPPSLWDSRTLRFYEPSRPHQENGIIAHLTEWIKWDTQSPQETLNPYKRFPRHPPACHRLLDCFNFSYQKALSRSRPQEKFKDNLDPNPISQIPLQRHIPVGKALLPLDCSSRGGRWPAFASGGPSTQSGTAGALVTTLLPPAVKNCTVWPTGCLF
jgi:hypothetical protein